MDKTATAATPAPAPAAADATHAVTKKTYTRKALKLPKSRGVWNSSLVYNLRRTMLRQTASGFVQKVIQTYLQEKCKLDREKAKLLAVGLTTYVNTCMGRLRTNTPMRMASYTVRNSYTFSAERMEKLVAEMIGRGTRTDKDARDMLNALGEKTKVTRRVIVANRDDMVRALLPGLRGPTSDFTASVLFHFKNEIAREKNERKKAAEPSAAEPSAN